MNQLKKRVVVGLSGGVDSSVTAYLLQQKGYEVIALFMKNWEEDDYCPSSQDYEDALSVASQLGIPLYTVNFVKEYWERVFARCLEEYKAGYTPNPDIWCNQEIKFKVFFEKALSLDADYLATGHYARVLPGAQLGRGLDTSKDQSYFLYTLKDKVLAKVLFPLGELNKTEVREIASKLRLRTADKRDSTGICFVGKRPFAEFLSQFIEKRAGNFETPDGRIVGQHEGAHFFTIGQRKGLKIGGAGAAWFVVEKNMERNVVIVDQGEGNPRLYQEELFAQDVTWVGKTPTFPLYCTAKVRYRTEDVPCTVTQEGDKLHVKFDAPQKAITPRQSIVFYQDQVCLGGGRIC
jgi:tRNA-uridine 2-sulfurtransferase